MVKKLAIFKKRRTKKMTIAVENKKPRRGLLRKKEKVKSKKENKINSK